MNSKILIVLVLSLSGCGGNGGGSSETSTGGDNSSPGCNPCRIYSTAAALPNAGLGVSAAAALTAADAHCMADTKKPATGTFKAMLYSAGLRVACTTPNCSGGASENVNWVMSANKAYYRLDGTTLIGTTTSAGIFSFPVTEPETSIDWEYWTGIEDDYTGTNNCSNWTSSSNAITGGIGSSVDGDALINNIGAENCDTNFQGLLCIEQ